MDWVHLGLTELLMEFGFCNTGFGWIGLGLIGFYCFFRFDWVFTGFGWVLPGFLKLSWVLVGFTGCLPGLAG